MRRNSHRSRSSSGSARSGPISAGSPGGFGRSVRVTGAFVRGSGATKLSWPSGQPGGRAAPAGVARRALDRVVLAREVVDARSTPTRPACCAAARRAARAARPCPRATRSRSRARRRRAAASSPVSVASSTQSAHDDALAAGRDLAHGHRPHAVAVDERVGRDVPDQHAKPAARAVRREHRLEHGERHPRLVRQRAHAARAGAEAAPRPRRFRERVVRAVVGADRVAQPPVARGARRTARSRDARRAGRLGS